MELHPILFIVALPYIIFALVCLAILKLTAASVRSSLKNFHSKKIKNRVSAYVAALSLLLMVSGAGLLAYFALVGGPNTGRSMHLFGKDENLYADFQIGLILLGIGVLITSIVYAISRKLEYKKLSILVIAVVLAAISTIGIYHKNNLINAKRYHNIQVSKDKKINSLPDFYAPSSALKKPGANSKPYVLSKRYAMPSYDLTIDEPYFEIIGLYREKVKHLFDPELDNCNFAALTTGTAYAETGSCSDNVQIKNGILYISHQQTNIPRAMGVYIEKDYLYYVSTGTSREDIIQATNQLVKLDPETAKEYFILAL